ncbi:MAG: DUF2865 domain-containing protein [Bauldia sp.]
MLRLGRISGAVAAAMVALFALPAAAQDVCSALRGQLAQLDQNGGGQYQQLLNQLGVAQAQYNQLYAQAQAMGCIVLFQVFAPPQCGPIRQTLNQMQANVNAIERAVRQAGRGQDNAARANILTAMRLNNCSTQAPANTYRALCVRASDGFFYPLAYTATPDTFEEAATLCAAQCQGAELYVHRNPGEGVEDAVNLNGDRYADLPTAFAFQTAFNPQNACRPTPELQATIDQRIAEDLRNGGNGDLLEITVTGQLIPLPVPRPVFAEDPETLANRAGGFVPGEMNFPAGPAVADAGDAGGGVRLIGPAYYYAR